MNRREFTRNLAALGLAPLMPVPSLAKTAVPAASAGNSMMFINAWSRQYVRKVGACSPDQLAKHFGLVPETARHVTQHLIEKGVLAAPNALGISAAVNPIAPKAAATHSALPKKVLNQLDKLEPLELDTEEDLSARSTENPKGNLPEPNT